MSDIRKDKFSGGSGLSDEDGLAEDLRDVADDLAAVKAPSIAAGAVSPTAAADILAVGTAAAETTVVADAVGDVGSGALANDLKAKYNAAVTLLNELRTIAGTVRTLANELKADLAEARAVANEVRTDLNAISGATLKTTKG